MAFERRTRRSRSERLVLLGACALSVGAAPLPVERLSVPPGFRIALYAHPVPGARSMALGARGTVFVGTRDLGVVYAIADVDGDGRGETVRRFATGLETPNGVAYHDGALYVAELGRILRFDDAETRIDGPPRPVVVNDTVEHGSWNRSRKIGHRVSLVQLQADRAVSYRSFAYGWLQGESAWGRPVDVLVIPDGSLLVSDDLAGALYRITYDDRKNPDGIVSLTEPRPPPSRCSVPAFGE